MMIYDTYKNSESEKGPTLRQILFLVQAMPLLQHWGQGLALIGVESLIFAHFLSIGDGLLGPKSVSIVEIYI